MEVDEIGEIEKNLVQQLKSLCDRNGKEIDPITSVPIFCELAKVYENKTENKERNFIRSAALLYAAIVREPNNLQIKSELQRFCSAVLLKAKAKKVDADLVQNAKQVRQKLSEAKKEFGKRFDEIKIISADVDGDELLALEKKKVTDVRNLQNEVTGIYSELMRSVSENCIEIMGKPPCKYSVAAMGSLSQSEVTLFSDMEFIILLENPVVKSKDKEIILRYFRWFSTIFHMVIINFGETMIPSVAIPSLNWFYDKVTPNSVTFDDMMPHASKIPLGRQPTEKKLCKTKLIKTVDEMLEHLRPQKILKDGYHLGDMLSKTRYISGDKRTFDEYHQKSHDAVKRTDNKSQFSKLLQQIDEDLQNLDIKTQEFNLSVGEHSLNIKTAIYRSAPIFNAALGRIYSIKELSCFDIIDKLEENKRCSGIVAHKLRFMEAIACELRFKVYQSKGRQDGIFMEGSGYAEVGLGLVELIGKRSLSTFMVTTFMIHRMLREKLTPSAPLDLDRLEDAAWEFSAKLHMLFQLGLWNDMRKEITKLVSTIQLSDVGMDNCVLAVERLCQMKEYQFGLNLCRKILPLCEDVLDVCRTKVRELRCNIALGRYDARDVEAQVFELDDLMFYVEAAPPGDERRCIVAKEYAFCLYRLGCFFRQVDVLRRGLYYYKQWKQTLDAKHVKKHRKPVLLILYSDSLQRIGNFGKSIEVSHKVLGMLKETNRSTLFHMYIYDNLGRCYLGIKKYFKSFICCLEHARIIASIQDKPSDLKDNTQTAYEYLLTKNQNCDNMVSTLSHK